MKAQRAVKLDVGDGSTCPIALAHWLLFTFLHMINHPADAIKPTFNLEQQVSSWNLLDCHLELDLGDGSGRVKALGACTRTIEDSVTPV